MRFNSLHALRGLAALTVVIYHLFLSFPGALEQIDLTDAASWLRPETWLRYTPLRAFVNGRSAVVLFFVLSGFVLANSFGGGKGHGYAEYACRRVCRIYLPFAASILLAAGMYSLATPGPVSELSVWFNSKSWTEPLSTDLLLRHFAMTGVSEDMHLNNVMWSLVHELRISLVFPLIAMLISYRLSLAMGVFVGIWVVSTALGFILPVGVLSSFVDSAGYAVFFAIGAACFIHRTELLAIAARVNRWLAVVFILVLMSVPAGLPGAEALYGIASVLLIGVVLSNDGMRGAFEWRPNLWLGDISYSLYLCHLPILLLAFDKLHGRIDAGVIALGVVVASLACATLMYWVVEKPSMHLGRALRTRRGIA